MPDSDQPSDDWASSDDMLRSAKEDCGAPRDPPQETASEGERPDDSPIPTADSRRSEPVFVRNCSIQPARWLPTINYSSNTDFVLMVGGDQVARIKTHYTGANFLGADGVRETRVEYAEGRSWIIRAVTPGVHPTRTIFDASQESARHPIRNRIVTVIERDEQIAHTVGSIGRRSFLPTAGRFTATAHGTRFELGPNRKARRGTIDGEATLRLHGWGWKSIWRLTATQPFPLSVVLLHWHILIGDWQVESTA